jgi:hypothetical protein
MTVGTGVYAAAGWAKEGTKNTRAVPTNFIGFVQESLTVNQNFIRSQALGGGLRHTPRKSKGTKEVGGGISFELQPETMIDMFELMLGGTASTTGVGPYTHVFEGGDLATGTFQIKRPMGASFNQFDFIGSMVNQWTLAQNPGEFATLALDLFCYDMQTNQTAAAYAPDASPTPLTFQHLTVSDIDANTRCFDSLTITGANNLERSFKSCATDAGRAVIRENGRRTVSGTVSGDFEDMDAVASYLAGTEGALQCEWNAGASAIVTLDLNVFYTGAVPMVDGEGVVKQAIGFEAIVGDGNDDTDAITVTIVSTDSNA